MTLASYLGRARALGMFLLIAATILGCGSPPDEAPDTAEIQQGAQPTFKVTGTIRKGAGGVPLSGITVKLTIGKNTSTTVTASNGSYSFTGLKKGTYTVQPSGSGCTFTPPSVTLNGLSKDTVADFVGSGTNCGAVQDAGADAKPADSGADATDARTDAGADARPADSGADAADSCTPKTCAGSGVVCGPLADGCGHVLQCGTCPTGQTCSSAGQCVCQPITTCPAGQNCGTAPDGCGGTINCGACTPPDTCGGGGTPGVCGQSPCAPFNGGASCTPTEQRFVNKSVACYQCMVNAGCLDDTAFGDANHECGDLTGLAVRGGRSGTSRMQLCLDTIDCIMSPTHLCAASDVTICYCGSLGAGTTCSQAEPGQPDGACLTEELDGLEHLASDPPSLVLQDYTEMTLGAGTANQLFSCAKISNCDTFCSQ